MSWRKLTLLERKGNGNEGVGVGGKVCAVDSRVYMKHKVFSHILLRDSAFIYFY